MIFATRYNHQKSIPEINTGPNIVEKAGYIPAKDRIENMMLAGQRLVEHRNQMYDFEDEIDESYYDPTRSKNFDLSDAFILQNNLESKLTQKDNSKDSESAPKPSDEVLTE